MTQQEKISALSKCVASISFEVECEVCYENISCEVGADEFNDSNTIGVALFESGARYVENGKIDEMIVNHSCVCEDCYNKIIPLAQL